VPAERPPRTAIESSITGWAGGISLGIHRAARRAHRPCRVFDSVEDMTLRVDDPALDVTADDVLVLRNAGPKGAPGMPEAGYLPIPKKLARIGVKDMVRISDARMSGTCVRHHRAAHHARIGGRRPIGAGEERRTRSGSMSKAQHRSAGR